MTSVSASGGRSPVRLCRIVPQTNDPPAWLKAGRAFSFLSALPAIPLRDIPATGVRRPCSIPRFARQRHGTHVLLQGRQIAFERPCRHPRTSRRELSGEVFNCHLKPSNRSSDSLNDLLNSSSSSIASSSDFIEDSAILPAVEIAARHRWRHLFLAYSAAPNGGRFAPPNHPDEGALRPFRNPQASDLSFVICHIIFRT